MATSKLILRQCLIPYEVLISLTFKQNAQWIQRNPHCISKPDQWFYFDAKDLRGIKWVPVKQHANTNSSEENLYVII